MPAIRKLKTCSKGHTFYKSSDCPTCPICESERKPTGSFLALLAAPARRALERENIRSLKDLSSFSEEKILSLHGMGKSSLTKLRGLLAKEGLTFRG